VIALAPAGNPATLARNPRVQPSVAQAVQLIAAGHGAEWASFTSSNNGTEFSVTTTAAIFLSFTDPQGPAFPRALPRITVPVLWVAGDADRTQANADALSATLPGTVRNRMVHVSAPHLETPDAAIGPALDWLRPLQAG
jgi:pimeloyl-ACP methyl ester carboxylesterase